MAATHQQCRVLKLLRRAATTSNFSVILVGVRDRLALGLDKTQLKTLQSDSSLSLDDCYFILHNNEGNKYTSLRMNRNTQYSMDSNSRHAACREETIERTTAWEGGEKNKTNLNVLQPHTTPKVNRHSRCHPSEKRIRQAP